MYLKTNLLASVVILIIYCIFTQHKRNKHQFSWLWNKVSFKNGSKGTRLQEFLDTNQYNNAGILMYQRIFGEGFVTPGGMATTKVLYV